MSHYAYDPLGELISFTQSTGYGERYTYDPAGNMLEKFLTGTGGKTTAVGMSYNAVNQLIDMAVGSGSISYSHDTNGMRLSRSSYGNENRSTLEELLRGNIAGLPDVVEPVQDGNTSEDESVPEEYEWATTEYLYDLTQEYYQVISETATSAGGTSVTTAYAYGLERIAAYGTNADGGTYQTGYVYDGRGSVAQTVTVHAAGQSTSSAITNVQVTIQNFAYTAYGEQMGTVKVSGFTYNAEAYDAANFSENYLFGSLKKYSLNVNTALRLLQQDGWKFNESGKRFSTRNDTLRYKQLEDGTLIPLVLNLGVTENNRLAAIVEELLRPNCEKLGIELNIHKMSFEDLLNDVNRVGERTCNMYLLSTNFSFEFDPYYTYRTDESSQILFNTSGIEDQQLSELTLAMHQTAYEDWETYFLHWVDFQVRWNEILPAIPLYSGMYFDAYTVRLKGYYPGENYSWATAIMSAKLQDK